ncbi:DUF4261 domain-containing protein [Burkholderia sp. Bp9017]|uniref:DUF4261 domain-containing protein n=1 Tax=Burkholderia anthina TaxID=179879 RepID=A0A7T6VJS0_9BURK|nr:MULTISPECIES: DUF4261 domain-containing protein [Burkholderia]MBY4870848.1 DUF4261 domain-containing protein [Burkholderia anthina]QQK05226.1 DUF4261 domain-containing protein [Burkholderia anthina]RQZ20254.1 DUF4261 domain-containing protein [Burkholderia sp. Bp9017]RQZ29451.1 DUF4261 domain-containing protein [Burkholderia sp. Bp9016]
MSLISRFFGRKDTPENAAALVAAADIDNPLSVAVVFDGPLQVDIDALTAALRAYHPSMSQACVETEPTLEQVFGLAGWSNHVVRLVGFDAPYPSDALEACVAPAHYGQDLKQQVRASRSHVILYYAGHEANPLDQYVALAAVAGALAGQSGLAVLNERAHTSLPAGVFDAEELGEESLEVLREIPLNLFFCGFVKYEVEGTEGVWMRTYGADVFGLPDFAALAAGHHEGERYSGIFNNVMHYLLQSGARMHAGETMQVGADTFMKLREPLEHEYYLKGPAQVLVAELISADEINR